VIASPSIHKIRCQAAHKLLISIGYAISIVIVEDGKERRMTNPDGTIPINDTANMIDSAKCGDGVHDTIHILIDASQYLATILVGPKRSLFITRNIDSAGRLRGNRDWIIDLRRPRE
jgi:hypothetical protein